MINYTGAKAVPINMLEKNDLTINPEKILSSINEKTRLIIINNPNNPTGAFTEKDKIDQLAEGLKKFPNVVVDMGAIQFVCKGANIMRPGIKDFSDFKKGDIVCVIEESQQKFLAVGIAEMSSDELKEAKKGEVIKNMHYISDNFWEIGKELSL